MMFLRVLASPPATVASRTRPWGPEQRADFSAAGQILITLRQRRMASAFLRDADSENAAHDRDDHSGF
ncbi:hypothetical protein RSSM_02127 [Rhodopirellula sallentina SM41]|uniref:Uncharacterized protein n=1 Tax=Rhodopirellula sallentina SM41 TaxID=1263870 RepID=M5UF08_9BACT|nr:hypothetical protein RSSM_02127 [Rhodopirellula sallentina SM41]